MNRIIAKNIKKLQEKKTTERQNKMGVRLENNNTGYGNL